MKEDYVNSFLAPAKMVWEKEMGANLEVVGAEVTSNQFTTVVPQILVKFTSSVGGLAVRIGLTENSRPD